MSSRRQNLDTTDASLADLAHRVTEIVERVHDAQSADDLPRLRRELYLLRQILWEALA